MIYIWGRIAATRRTPSTLLKLFLQNFCIYHILHFASHSPLFLHLSFLRKFRWTSTLSILFSFTIFPLFSPIFPRFFSFHFRSPIDSLSRVRFFAHFTLSPTLFFYRRISCRTFPKPRVFSLYSAPVVEVSLYQVTRFAGIFIFSFSLFLIGMSTFDQSSASCWLFRLTNKHKLRKFS